MSPLPAASASSSLASSSSGLGTGGTAGSASSSAPPAAACSSSGAAEACTQRRRRRRRAGAAQGGAGRAPNLQQRCSASQRRLCCLRQLYTGCIKAARQRGAKTSHRVAGRQPVASTALPSMLICATRDYASSVDGLQAPRARLASGARSRAGATVPRCCCTM